MSDKYFEKEQRALSPRRKLQQILNKTLSSFTLKLASNFLKTIGNSVLAEKTNKLRSQLDITSTFKILINRDAFRENLHLISQKVGGPDRMIVVAKSNAYGTGQELILEAYNAGVRNFAVENVRSAIELKRHLNVNDVHIMCLYPVSKEEIPYAIRNNITLSVSSLQNLHEINQEAIKQHKKNVPIEIQIETGMNRFGINSGMHPNDAELDTNKLAKSELMEAIHLITEGKTSLVLNGLFTHFPVADDPTKDNFTKRQIEIMQKIISCLHAEKIKVPRVHLANSPGLLRFPETYMQHLWEGTKIMTRPGGILFGCPAVDPGPPFRRDVMSVETEILEIQTISPYQSFGYSGLGMNSSKTNKFIAIVGIGHSNGIDKRYSNKSSNKSVLHIDGIPCPLVGAVSMNATMIEIPPQLHEKVKRGSRVMVIGEDFTALDFAQSIGSVASEIMPRFTQSAQNGAGSIEYEGHKTIKKSGIPPFLANFLKELLLRSNTSIEVIEPISINSIREKFKKVSKDSQRELLPDYFVESTFPHIGAKFLEISSNGEPSGIAFVFPSRKIISGIAIGEQCWSLKYHPYEGKEKNPLHLEKKVKRALGITSSLLRIQENNGTTSSHVLMTEQEGKIEYLFPGTSDARSCIGIQQYQWGIEGLYPDYTETNFPGGLSLITKADQSILDNGPFIFGDDNKAVVAYLSTYYMDPIKKPSVPGVWLHEKSHLQGQGVEIQVGATVPWAQGKKRTMGARQHAILEQLFKKNGISFTRWTHDPFLIPNVNLAIANGAFCGEYLQDQYNMIDANNHQEIPTDRFYQLNLLHTKWNKMTPDERLKIALQGNEDIFTLNDGLTFNQFPDSLPNTILVNVPSDWNSLCKNDKKTEAIRWRKEIGGWLQLHMGYENDQYVLTNVMSKKKDPEGFENHLVLQKVTPELIQLLTEKV